VPEDVLKEELLSVGQAMGGILGTSIVTTFEGVENDSRCPVDVTCIKAGEAFVRLSFRDGDEVGELTIEVPRDSSATATYSLLHIGILNLDPLPLLTEPIPQSRYQLLIRLTVP